VLQISIGAEPERWQVVALKGAAPKKKQTEEHSRYL